MGQIDTIRRERRFRITQFLELRNAIHSRFENVSLDKVRDLLDDRRHLEIELADTEAVLHRARTPEQQEHYREKIEEIREQIEVVSEEINRIQADRAANSEQINAYRGLLDRVEAELDGLYRDWHKYVPGGV